MAKITESVKPAKPAAKKTAAVKPAEPAAKKTAAVKPEKPTVKKTAAVKPEKTSAKKTAAAKPAKTSAKKTANTENIPKVLSLFDAYSSDRLPKDQGYIISSFINGNTGYSIYEVISYSGVKAIYPEGAGLTFQSQGKKLHVLIEPPSYPHKSIEPYLRDKMEQIPLRFKEVGKITSKNQSSLYWAKKPIESLSSFTVARPVGFNVSFVFYNRQDIYTTLAKFFEQSFTNDAGLPMSDARKGAEEVTAVVKKTMNFKGVYED
ncbi:MAG: hypothetical protein LBP29_10075 [Treponema sp.]|jgi:hypothetical protein|nr:hypothetical protein [Treponema sp.]